jgi:hypothetical protein
VTFERKRKANENQLLTAAQATIDLLTRTVHANTIIHAIKDKYG